MPGPVELTPVEGIRRVKITLINRVYQYLKLEKSLNVKYKKLPPHLKKKNNVYATGPDGL